MNGWVLIAACLAASAVRAQTLVHEVASPMAGDALGAGVVFLGDLNYDGRSEFAVAAPSAGRGYVQVHSGVDASLLYRWSGPRTIHRFGHSVRNAGDVDRDGVEDVVVGIPGDPWLNLYAAGMARVYSGVSGALLYSWSGLFARAGFGTSVDAAGDVDGDGWADVIVGEPSNGSAGTTGSFTVFSGRTGTALLGLTSPVPFARFGFVVKAVDFDADGQRDFVVSAPYSGMSGFGGIVWVYSGRNVQTILRTFGPRGGSIGFGNAVVGLGDVTGDGIDDLAIACTDGQIGGGPGYVDVVAGGSGALQFTLQGDSPGDGFGAELAPAGDRDGDGVNDLLVASFSSASNGGAYVRLFSGRTGATIATLRPNGNSMGIALSSSRGDVHGDGVTDLLLGLPGAAGNAGLAQVLTWEPAGLEASPASLSAAAGGSQRLALQVGNAHAGSSYLVLGTASGTTPGFALGALLVPLNPDAYTAFTLFTPNTPLLASSAGTLDSVGMAQAQLALPRRVPGLIGLQLHHATLYATGGELFSTNAQSLLITP